MAENNPNLLRRSLNDFLRLEVDDAALDRLTWRDFGNGLSMSRLARADKRELVLYRIAAGAAPDAFVKHEHLGGEFYLMLKGKIADETGEYEKGDMVFLDPNSVHRPRAVGQGMGVRLLRHDYLDILTEPGTGESCQTSAIYTHGPGMDDPIIRTSASGLQYYHQDGLGSVVGVTNQNGGIEATASYDAWGKTIASTGTISQYGYTGREPDETGMIYYRARYYDPSIGRFTQRDPIGMVGGMNLYAYVNNNPINFNDPMGLALQTPTNSVGFSSSGQVTVNDISYVANNSPGINVGCQCLGTTKTVGANDNNSFTSSTGEVSFSPLAFNPLGQFDSRTAAQMINNNLSSVASGGESPYLQVAENSNGVIQVSTDGTPQIQVNQAQILKFPPGPKAYGGGPGQFGGAVTGWVLGSRLGSTAGVAAGVELGMTYGGMLGLPAGPLGSFAGAIIGGFVGGAVGGLVGGMTGAQIGGTIGHQLFDRPCAGALNCNEPLPPTR